jgi:hypothetical protein
MDRTFEIFYRLIGTTETCGPEEVSKVVRWTAPSAVKACAALREKVGPIIVKMVYEVRDEPIR